MLPRHLLFLLTTFAVLLFTVEKVNAFGAGNIPSFAYLEGKAFRHGDIEDVLEKFVKSQGGFLGRGKKFTPLDIKRVYFGNWLRDYSQAVDIASLKKTNYQTIVNLLMALGFMTFGYATAEFEITEQRLGCYLPTEHIDNPKGYGGIGAAAEDPRKYYPGLRPPIDPRELDIDERTGMKNYIANENGGWDTSTALVKRTLAKCIHHARLHRANGNEADEYEAYRLLGQALHTLEDFSAHSNFVELALISLGHTNVFPHVGNNVRVRDPQGRMVPPIITGTFGGADFIHSLLGEAGDHLSEASISDLSRAVDKARSADNNNTNAGLRSLLGQLPGSEGQSLSRDMDDITRGPAGGGQNPNNMSPQEIHATLWKILSFRDKVMKGIEVTIEKIPGLGALIEKITNSINVFVFTTIEPYLGPILKTATGGLTSLGEEVINDKEQFAVFTDPNASDPTHSFLSKDHFGLILNEPAGRVAQIIISHAITKVVAAWDDNNINPDTVANGALEGLFNPFWHNTNSAVQREMLEYVRQWIGGVQNRDEILRRLTMDSVKAGNNRRPGDTSGGGHNHASGVPSGGLQGVLASNNIHVPGAQYLNMGQDLLAGKAPWSQGFGGGGPQAWRDVDGQAPSGGNSNADVPLYIQQQQPGYNQYDDSGAGGSGYPGAARHHPDAHPPNNGPGGGSFYPGPPGHFAGHGPNSSWEQPFQGEPPHHQQQQYQNHPQYNQGPPQGFNPPPGQGGYGGPPPQQYDQYGNPMPPQNRW